MFASPVLYIKKFKDYQFEEAPIEYPVQGAHMFWAGPVQTQCLRRSKRNSRAKIVWKLKGFTFVLLIETQREHIIRMPLAILFKSERSECSVCRGKTNINNSRLLYPPGIRLLIINVHYSSINGPDLLVRSKCLCCYLSFDPKLGVSSQIFVILSTDILCRSSGTRSVTFFTLSIY